MMTLIASPPCSSSQGVHTISSRGDARRAKGLSRVAETLLQRVARGEPNAVRDTIDRYSALVWSLARRLSPTRADAEDAVQEIFISLWKSADRYDPGTAKESTFVAMVARRRLIDRMRKTGRRPDIGGAELNESLAPPVRDGHEENVINGEHSRIVAEAFRELSQDQQRVLRLSLQHGQSHSQIAESTGIPLGTVKTHARRGLIRLKEAIGARTGGAAEVSA
jgi:RNA polymerase sigma-70 factor (ECF subfamily)